MGNQGYGRIESQRPRRRKERLSCSLRNVVYFIGLILYLELVFHLYVFRKIDAAILYPILFALPAGGFFGICTNFLRKRGNYRLAVGITVVLCIFYCAQVVYHAVFQTFLALFSVLGVAGQAFDFLDVVFENILDNIFGLLLLLLPVVFVVMFGKRTVDFRKKPPKLSAVIFGAVILTHLICLIALSFGEKEMYSPYSLYYNNESLDMSIQTLGVFTTQRLDAKYAIFGEPKKSGNDLDYDKPSSESPTEATSPTKEGRPEETEAVTDTSPNVMNIDLNGLMQNSPEEIASMAEYFSAQTPTNKNEYTGMFKGYNVIFVTAEGFSKYAVDKDRTPTLYKLINEGFVFKNYYNPLWYGSTVGGEYANLTGSMPKDGGYLSMTECGEKGNDMYFTLGRQLGRLGYKTMAFHNNSSTYYDRNISNPNMGYEWIAAGTGYEPEVSETSGKALWPQSDLKMIEDTFDMYADHQPFHAYYLTVSGHVQYNFGGNAMSIRNRDVVEDLPYSDTAKAYLACQYELEKAMTALLQKLEEKGIADKTVIVLAADHIPYDNKEMCDELAGHELEEIFEWCESNLIIWSGSMEQPVEVDKYCSSIDILPTLSNLLGLEYDSRLLIGSDILSDAPALVMFKSRSFITDKCFYNAKTKEVTPINGAVVDDEYISSIRKIVRNKFNIGEMIVDNDFYSYIDPYK